MSDFVVEGQLGQSCDVSYTSTVDTSRVDGSQQELIEKPKSRGRPKKIKIDISLLGGAGEVDCGLQSAETSIITGCVENTGIIRAKRTKVQSKSWMNDFVIDKSSEQCAKQVVSNNTNSTPKTVTEVHRGRGRAKKHNIDTSLNLGKDEIDTGVQSAYTSIIAESSHNANKATTRVANQPQVSPIEKNKGEGRRRKRKLDAVSNGDSDLNLQSAESSLITAFVHCENESTSKAASKKRKSSFGKRNCLDGAKELKIAAVLNGGNCNGDVLPTKASIVPELRLHENIELSNLKPDRAASLEIRDISKIREITKKCRGRPRKSGPLDWEQHCDDKINTSIDSLNKTSKLKQKNTDKDTNVRKKGFKSGSATESYSEGEDELVNLNRCISTKLGDERVNELVVKKEKKKKGRTSNQEIYDSQTLDFSIGSPLVCLSLFIE